MHRDDLFDTPAPATFWAAGPQVDIDGTPHRPLEGIVPLGFEHWPVWLSPRDEHDLIGKGVDCHPDFESERFVSDRARRDEVRGKLRLIRGDLGPSPPKPDPDTA